MSFTGLSLGPSVGGGRFSATPGRIANTYGHGINYPSPFFDLAHTHLPTTVKSLFRYCRYYFLTNPLINATAFKLSEYPITDIIIDHDDEKVKKRWMEYFHDHLRYRAFQVETGLDYHVFGNCISTVSFPFHKYLTCKTCGWSERADKTRPRWRFTNFEYRLSCPACGTTGDAHVYDHYYPDASGLKLIRWNVEDVEVTYNDITGESTYFYTIPKPLQGDIMLGKKDVVDSIPSLFIQAMKKRKGIVFSKDNLFHLKRPTLSGQDRGWGPPLILPVLKDTFYLQLMKKAQEAVLLEHIVPLRVIFPQGASGTSDPFTTLNLVDWKEQVAAEIARWRHDCVSPDTLVEVEDGVVTADQVGPGSLLRNHRGGYSRVEKVWRRPLREGERSYKVHVRGLGGVAPVVSEGHPFLASRKVNTGNGHKLGDAKFIRAKDLREGDYLGYPTYRPETPFPVLDLAQYTDRACTALWCYIDHTSTAVPEAFELMEQGLTQGLSRKELCKKYGWTVNQYKAAQAAHREGRTLRRVPRLVETTDEFFWILGLYLAEGSASRKQVLFAANKKEEKLYQGVYRFFSKVFAAEGFCADKGGDGCQHVFSSVVAAQVFTSLCAGDSRTKRIHQRLMELPRENVLELLRGMLEGDGCWHEDGKSNKTSFSSASSSLACGLQRLLISLGVAAGVSYAPPSDYDIQGNKGRTSGVYRVGVYGPSNNKLRALLGREPREEMPSAVMGVFRDGYFWFRISEVEELHTEEVIGFQMDSSEVRVQLDDGEAHGTFCLPGMASANSNYIPIMPVPMGQQSIGGDGKALLLFNEMQAQSEHIIMGMGVPREFLMGGLSYAGTNVSMRMLENAFINYIGRQKAQAHWVMKSAANYLKWPEVKIRFKPFKMADDLQRKAYLFQLNQAGKVSDTTLLNDADLNQAEENEIMANEADKRIDGQKKQQIAMAEIQGEAQLIMMKYQAKAQQAMAESQQPPAPGEPGDGMGGIPAEVGSPIGQEQRLPSGPEGQPAPVAGGDIVMMAQGLAQQVAQLPPQQQQEALMAIEAQSPELAQLVQQMLSAMQGGEQPQEQAPAVDMRPLPQQLPARRETTLV